MTDEAMRDRAMSEDEVVAEVRSVTVERLRSWVAEGWVRPSATGETVQFRAIDIARVRLISDLEQDLAVGEEVMPIVLSLLDQIYNLRAQLRDLTTAVEELDEATQARLRQRLGRSPRETRQASSEKA